MNNIAKTLVHNLTVHNNKEATVNGGQIGVDAYASWKSALENAWRDFYKYRRAMQIVEINPDKSCKDERIQAFNSLQSILDLVGEVNGHAIHKSPELLDDLSKHAMAAKKSLTGDAMRIQSELKNLKAEFEKPNNGATEEWTKSMEEQISAKEEELKLAKKQAGSASKFDDRAKFQTFARNFETNLAKVINGQVAKSWEELEAEDQARKDAARARRKASRDANKKK